MIEADGISAYYNGQFVCKVDTSRTVRDFGSDLVAFIGRSPYADKFFKGSVRDLKIYAEALTAQDV